MRKGEKSTTVVFWKFAHDTAESQEDGAGRSRLLFTRGYSVFNAAQVDGYTPKAEPSVLCACNRSHSNATFPSLS